MQQKITAELKKYTSRSANEIAYAIKRDRGQVADELLKMANLGGVAIEKQPEGYNTYSLTERTMTAKTENNLNKLNELLFAQLEKISMASGEELKACAEQSKAVSNIARDIISTQKLSLEAATFAAEHGRITPLPAMLHHDGA